MCNYLASRRGAPAHSFLLISFRRVPRQPRSGNQHSGWLATCTRVVGVGGGGRGEVWVAAGADCGGLKWKLLHAIHHASLASGTVRGDVLQLVAFQSGGGGGGVQEGTNVAQEHLRAQLWWAWRKEKKKRKNGKKKKAQPQQTNKWGKLTPKFTKCLCDITADRR